MLVDDESDQIRSLQLAIESEYGDEYKIIPTNSGTECLNILNNEIIPNLILLDIMIPEMTGCTVFEIIKANPKFLDMPIVFLTARTDEIAKNGRISS